MNFRQISGVAFGLMLMLAALPSRGQEIAAPDAAAPDGPTAEILAKATLCASCHGASGVPNLPIAPVLWGQQEGYIYLQLKDLKNKVRVNAAMNAIASTLSREDMFALAKYFASKPWPNLQQPEAPADVAKVALTANSSVGCTGCHLANYQGDSSVPRLAGQKHDYLLSTMLAFRDRSRGNNPGMSDLMNASSEDDLKAMALYLAGL